MKKFTCYSLARATKLVDMGFPVIDTALNTKDPRYKVFYFEDTEEFRKAFEQIA